MKRTMEAFSSKKFRIDLYNDIMSFLSMMANYKHYRRYLKAVSAPCIPFIGEFSFSLFFLFVPFFLVIYPPPGVFVADLTFLDDGNPNEISVKYATKEDEKEEGEEGGEEEGKGEVKEAKLINLLKRTMLANQIRGAMKYSEAKYRLLAVIFYLFFNFFFVPTISHPTTTNHNK